MIQQVDAPLISSQILCIHGGEDKKYAIPFKNLTAVEVNPQEHHLRLFSHIFETQMLELKFANDIPRIASSIHRQITGDSWAVLEDSAEIFSGKKLYVNALRITSIALTSEGALRITTDNDCQTYNVSGFSSESRTKFFDAVKDRIIQGDTAFVIDQPNHRVALDLRSIDLISLDHTSKSAKFRPTIDSGEIFVATLDESLSACKERLIKSIELAHGECIAPEMSTEQKVDFFINTRNVKSSIFKEEGPLHLHVQFAKHLFSIRSRNEDKDKLLAFYEKIVFKANSYSPMLAFTHGAAKISVSKKEIELVDLDRERRMLTLYSKCFPSNHLRWNDIDDSTNIAESVSRQLSDRLWTVLDDASQSPTRRFFVNIEQVRFAMFQDYPKLMMRCGNLWYSFDTRSFTYARLSHLYATLKQAMMAYLRMSQTPVSPENLVSFVQGTKQIFLPEREIEAIHIRPRAGRIDLISKLFPDKFLKIVLENAQDFNLILDVVTGSLNAHTMRVLEDRQRGLGRKRMYVNLSHLHAFRIDRANAFSFLSRVGPLEFQSATFGSDLLAGFFKTMRKSYTTYALSERVGHFIHNQPNQAQQADVARVAER